VRCRRAILRSSSGAPVRDLHSIFRQIGRTAPRSHVSWSSCACSRARTPWFAQRRAPASSTSARSFLSGIGKVNRVRARRMIRRAGPQGSLPRARVSLCEYSRPVWAPRRSCRRQSMPANNIDNGASLTAPRRAARRLRQLEVPRQNIAEQALAMPLHTAPSQVPRDGGHGNTNR